MTCFISFSYGTTLCAAASSSPGTGLDFPTLLQENIEKDAREVGLQLVTRSNSWDRSPASHKELIQCVDRDSIWNPDRSGFSTIDTIELLSNPHGVDLIYTAKYSGFFLVEEEGEWRFAINSSGPSEIEIDGRVITSWYGEHDSGNFFDSHSGSRYLQTGWHRIVLRYASLDTGSYAEARFMPPSADSWKKVSTAELRLRSYPPANGLQLITRKNTRNSEAVDHEDLFVFVEIQPENHVDYYGWSVVDEIDQAGNIHGLDDGFTSRYETFFQVVEGQSGDWTFSLDSGDASELEINGETVVSWYGGHEPSGDTSLTGIVTLQPGWHRLVLRNAQNTSTPRSKVMFQAPQDTAFRLLSVSELPLKTFIHDLDDDGIHNDLEGILGTGVENPDTDGEGLTDFAEAMLDTDPLNPDSNGDGLGDAAELLSDNPDPDGDNVDNLFDSDNDGDGVIDALDTSPFSATAHQELFQFEIDTSGKHTYLDFQIRPQNPMNLMLNGKKWDWPYDTKGQMQDRDNSTDDITLMPMLEITANIKPDQEELTENGIAVANDPLLYSVDGHYTHNDGFGTGDVLGSGQPQVVVAGDRDNRITVRDRSGNAIRSFDSVFSTGDKLAVADVLGDEKEEILVFNDYNSMVYIYSGEGHLITKESIVFKAGYPVAVGDYRDDNNVLDSPDDQKAEIVVGDPDSRRIFVFGIYKLYDNYEVFHSNSAENTFSVDDGLAMADVDGDGRKEILAAHNVDDRLSIYSDRYDASGGERFYLLNTIDIDFDRSDGLIGADILPADDPAAPRYGEEIMVLKRGGGAIVYTEQSRDSDGDMGSVAYSTYDGYGASNLLGDERREVLVASDTSGVLRVYGAQTSKAYVPLAPVLDNGTPVAFQGRMIYNATGGPVTLNADVRLVWFVVGKTDSEENPDAGKTTILATYRENFRLTGFAATEQRGTSAALFHNDSSPDVGRDQVASAFSMLDHFFIHGHDQLDEVITTIREPSSNIAVTVTDTNPFEHDFSAIVWSEDQLKTIVTETLVEDGVYPVALAFQSDSASVDLADLLDSGDTSDKFRADLSSQASVISKSIKMNWYDTSSAVVSPLTIDELEVESDSWGLSEEEKAQAMTVALVASLGSTVYTDGADSSPLYQATDYDALTYLKKGGGLVAGFFFAGESGRNMYWAAKATRMTNANTAIRGYNVSKAKFAKMYKISTSSNLMAKASRFSSTTRVIAKFGGPVVGVAMAAYTFYQIGSDSGWSNSGVATAELYAGMQFGYFMALGMISTIPVAGPVIVVLVVVSDAIYWAITGEAWSDKAMDWVVEQLTEDNLPDPHFKITDLQVTVTDYKNNGITVGDRIEFRSRATERIKRYSETDESDEERDWYYRDMKSSYLQPSAYFFDSSRYDKGSSRFLVDYDISEYQKQKIWDFGAWAEPKEADTDFYASVRMQTDLKLYYRHCTVGQCDRESFSDTYKSDYTRLYFDVLPDTLAEFVSWSVITPLDSDDDGIDDSGEDDPDGPWFTISGTTAEGVPAILDAGDSAPDGSADYVFVSEGSVDPVNRRQWRIEPDGNGYFQVVNRQYDTFALSGLVGDNNAWLNSGGGDDALWEFKSLRNDEAILINKGLTSVNGSRTVLAVPAGHTDGAATAADVASLGSSPINPLWRMQLTGGGTSRDAYDSDGDGLSDSFELNAPLYGMNLDAFSADTDNDGLTDRQELEIGSDPTAADTDLDGLDDGQETRGWQIILSYNGLRVSKKVYSSPVVYDSDGDGLSDQEEFTAALKLNPASQDSDGDGVSDPQDADPVNPPAGTVNSDSDDLYDETETAGWEIEVTTAAGTTTRAVTSDPNDADTDNDGLLDHQEYLASDPGNGDSDGDGLSDNDEQLYGTNILHFDSDGDGLSDGDEIAGNSDPRNSDTDNDGLGDGEEVFTHGTSPILNDSDGDGLSDSDELQLGTSPTIPDTDGDGLTDGAEIHAHRTDPLVQDSDGDGLRDDLECLTHNTNPNNTDTDGDGLADGEEIALSCSPWPGHTSPLLTDTDADSLGDYEEVYQHGTNPCSADSDGDGLSDIAEINLGSDPNLFDTDGDSISDGEEVNKYGTNPLNIDTDGDHLGDYDEIHTFGSNPTASDTDGDTIPDDMDPDTLPIAEIRIPELLVLYDEVTDQQDNLIAELEALFGIGNILHGTSADFPDMADYAYILMLGLPDDLALDGSVGDLMDQLLDVETKTAMLAEQNALELGISGEELEDAELLSLVSRFGTSAVPAYNGLPAGGIPPMPLPSGPQVDLGLENSLIVMLTQPLANDTSKIINQLVSLRTEFWENFVMTQWIPADNGLVTSFTLDGQKVIDAEISAAELNAPGADTGIAALARYSDNATAHQLRDSSGLAAGQEPVGKYILAEFAGSYVNGIPPVVPLVDPLNSTTLRIYYTALDLDRSLPKDNDINDIGDLNEDTLTIYHWNGTDSWDQLSTDLSWVTALTFATGNITINGIDYEGYAEVTMTGDLGMFALAGIPHPDTTVPGAPAVVATSPATDAVNVALDTPVVVTFSETVAEENLGIVELEGAVILSATLNDNILTIEHDGFTPGVSYSVLIPASSVVDPANLYNEEYSWSFTTAEPNNIPFANDDDLSCSENDSLTVNVLDDHGHGADWDSENDPLTITSLNGDPGALGNPVPGSGGGLFALQSNGDLLFTTNDEFASLPAGAQVESSIAYTLDDTMGSDTATVTVTVSGANNRPVLSPDERSLSPVYADAGNDNGTDGDGDNDLSDNFDNPGDLVADIIASAGTAADTDNDLLGMAVTGVDNRSGAWEYSLDNMTWQAMNSLLSEFNSLLLPPEARIRFVSDPHINCTKTSNLNFKLWDQTSGTGGVEYWNTTTGDAFSTDEAPATLQVNSLPWLPSAGDYDGDGIENCEDDDPLQKSMVDLDNDGIDDEWEYLYFNTLDQLSADSDFDGDNYADLYEYLNWLDGILDPDGYGFDPTVINAAGGNEYGTGLDNPSFWLMMMPAILNGK